MLCCSEDIACFIDSISFSGPIVIVFTDVNAAGTAKCIYHFKTFISRHNQSTQRHCKRKPQLMYYTIVGTLYVVYEMDIPG